MPFYLLSNQQVKQPFLFLLFLLLTFQSNGQFVDVRLWSDGSHCDGIQEFQIQVKTATISQELVKLGSSSILLNYDPLAVDFIQYDPIEFDKNTSLQAQVAKWSPQKFTLDEAFGLFNLSLIKQSNGEEHYELSSEEWITIGKIVFRFNSQFPNASTTLKANMDYTYFTNLAGFAIGLTSIPSIVIEKPVLEDAPNLQLTTAHSLCGNRNGSITVSFNKKSTASTVSISLDGGFTFQPPVSIADGQVTYENLKTGTYEVFAQWNGTCAVPLQTVQIEKIGPNAPKAKFKTKASTCGLSNGSITFTFENTEQIAGMEFSLDGGNTYLPTVPIEEGIITYEDIAAGAYDVWVRWANDDCPISLGTATVKNNHGLPPVVEVTPRDAICSFTNGQLTFQFEPIEGRTHIEFSLDDGQTYRKKVSLASQTVTYGDLTPDSYSVWARWGNDQCPVHLGTFDIQNLLGQGPIVQISQEDATCGDPNGRITMQFEAVDGRSHIQFSLDNGQSYLPAVALTDLQATYGALSTGSYHIWARWDNEDCPTDLGTMTIKNKDGFPPTAQVASYPANCGADNGQLAFSFEPTPGRSKVEFSLDGGQSFQKAVALKNQTVTYDNLAPGSYDVWARWGDDSCPQQLGTYVIDRVPGQAPQPITSVVHATCGNDNGALAFTFDETPGRNGISFSLDNGQTYQPPVLLTDQEVVFEDLAPANYHIWARWENEECPIFIGKYRIKNQYQPPVLTCQANTSSGSLIDQETCQIQVCLGETLSLSVNPNRMASYEWSGPNGFEALGNKNGDVTISDAITTLESGIYTVTVTNKRGCVSTQSIEVIVQEQPAFYISEIVPATCNQNNGLLTLTIDNPTQNSTYWLSLNGGQTYDQEISLQSGTNTITIDHLGGDTYNIWGRWPTQTCGNHLVSTEVPSSYAPEVEVYTQDVSCGEQNGIIAFSFSTNDFYQQIEISLDGGKSYFPPIDLALGVYAFNQLQAGTYHAFARWADGSCAVDLGIVVLEEVGCGHSLSAPIDDNVMTIAKANANRSVDSYHNPINPTPEQTNNKTFLVQQNTPNPFVTTTDINFHVSQPGLVQRTILHANGQIIQDQSVHYLKGNHTWTIERGNLAAGIYYYRIRSQSQQVIRKMIITNL